MLHLNWATWAARRRIMGAGGYLEDAAPGKLIASLTNSSHTLYNTPRTAKQRKKRNLASFLSLLHSASILPTDLLIFTDGGANPNPGPCGAGAFLVHSVDDKEDLLRNPHSRIYTPIGNYGTSNLGELYALGIASEYALTLDLTHTTHIHTFVDSKWALQALAGSCKVPRYILLAQEVKKRYAALRRRAPATLYWIAGHSGNQGGNIADTLATRAVQDSIPLPFPTLLLPPASSSFLFHKLDP